ncbi:HAMP domain-containing sensor histidine kinase [Clostridium sp. CTA-5]
MRSIRTKISLIFAIAMFFMIILGVVINNLFLEKYYIYKNKNIFIDINDKIKDKYVNDRENFSDYIKFINEIENVNCIVTDSNLQVQYTSITRRGGFNPLKLPKDVEKIFKDNEEKLSNTYVYSIIEKSNDQEPKVVFLSKMDNGELIILRKSMKGISESVSISNQFYIIVGGFIISIGIIIIFIFSNRITKPIRQISNIAEDISNLNFNERVVYDSQDEIGSLGKSINKMSEKLKDAMDVLKHDVERRKQLVRNISHELKTPIGVIKGYAEGLKYGVANDKENREKYCMVISEECDRMNRMVKELLNLSMMESEVFELKKSKFDIEGLIKNIVDRFNPTFVEKYITLDLNIQKDLVVLADYGLIERVINNYIINALHHLDEKKVIRIIGEKKESGVRVSVFNSGNHIPENELRNIWDVFYKVDKARSRQYGGHGIGLSIVKLIAELHGGIAGVENVDDGVLFFIDLP